MSYLVLKMRILLGLYSRYGIVYAKLFYLKFAKTVVRRKELVVNEQILLGNKFLAAALLAGFFLCVLRLFALFSEI